MNRFDTFSERFRVPSRTNAFASLSIIEPSGSRRDDAATGDAIQKKTAKSAGNRIEIITFKSFVRGLLSKRELSNAISQAVGIPVEDHRPNCGNFRINFNQRDMVGEIKFGNC